MKKSLLCFIGWTLFLFCGIIVVNAQTSQQVAKKALTSTVLLVIEDANGQPLSLGSGFFVSNGQVATNLHVVEGAAKGYAKLVNEKTKYDIEGITAVDAERDLVILKISALGVQELFLEDSDTVQVGEPVYVAGNPRGLEGTFSEGIISSIRKVGTDKLLQLTAPISPGSSGGPVLNSKGEVIGVSIATFRGGQNLNFAIPSNYLKALVAQMEPAKPLSQTKPARSKRSILADLGGRSTEGVIGDQLTWTIKQGYKHLIPVYRNKFLYNDTEYTFSLRNRLRESIKNVYCLVIFYDEQGYSIDVDVVQFQGLILAGLAKRVMGSKVSDSSVKELSTNYQALERTLKGSVYEQGIITRTRVEFRILDFEIVE